MSPEELTEYANALGFRVYCYGCGVDGSLVSSADGKKVAGWCGSSECPHPYSNELSEGRKAE